MPPAVWVATFGGAGLLRPAAGTWGSLAAGVLAWGVLFLPLPSWSFPVLFLLLTVLFLYLGLMACPSAMRHFDDHDPGPVVIDEAAGMMVGLAWVCWMDVPTWLQVLVVFATFRLFDTTKVLGVRRLERLAGAWGVMADDLLAGCYAGGLSLVLLWWLPLAN